MTTKMKVTADPAARLAEAKQQARDRLTAAAAAEQDARDRLAALRERHKTVSDVTAQQLGDAAHALELAELGRQGAEEALAEAGRLERLEVLADIRAEIEVHGRPARAADAFTRASDALADLIGEIGPDRARLVSGWIGQLHKLGVGRLDGALPPAAEDGHLALSDAGGQGGVIWIDDDGAKRSVHVNYNLVRILSALVYRASSQAGVPANLFGVSITSADNGLVSDPGAWFDQHG